MSGLADKKVHHIFGNAEELKKIKQTYQLHKHKSNRLLQATTINEESNSYITKFVFSLAFILITAFSLCAIACMQNPKDTLLYAKFIADVGR